MYTQYKKPQLHRRLFAREAAIFLESIFSETIFWWEIPRPIKSARKKWI